MAGDVKAAAERLLSRNKEEVEFQLSDARLLARHVLSLTSPDSQASETVTKCPTENIWAGCDIDERVKLYRIIDGVSVPITLDDWLKVLDHIGAEPGEMLVVAIGRELAP